MNSTPLGVPEPSGEVQKLCLEAKSVLDFLILTISEAAVYELKYHVLSKTILLGHG